MHAESGSTISLDFEFADERVDSTYYGSSWTLLDYDIAIWNPAKLLTNYQSELYASSHTYRGRPALSDDESSEIARDVGRRKQEMLDFLDLGRTLVILLPEPQSFFVATGEREYSGTGRNRQTTRLLAEMELEEAFPVTASLVPATGEKMRLVGDEPFASFWRAHKESLYYAAYMKEPFGKPLAVIHGTQYAVASVGRVEKGGLVLILPQLALAQAPGFVDEDDSKAIAREEKRAATEKGLLDGLFDLVASFRKSSGDYSLPEWAAQVLLPGEQEAIDAVSKEQERLARLQEKVAVKKRELGEIQERKLLIAGSGAALEATVGQAFEALGFKVEPGPPGGFDLMLRYSKTVALVEVKGKSRSAAKADASQLEGWVSDYELEHGTQPKAVLVATTWREVALPERTENPFPDSMREYSEKRDHCLITGVQLLGAWLDAEANTGRKKQIRESILACVGMFTEYPDWKVFLQVQADSTEKAGGAQS